MFAYLFFFLFVLFFSFYASHNKTWGNILSLSVIFIIAIFAGIRFNVGADFQNYEIIFEQIGSYADTTFVIEPGFFLLNFCIAQIGGNFSLLLLVCACFSIFLAYRSIQYFCSPQNNWIAFIAIISSTYYLVYIFSGIRQGIAMSFFLYSLRYMVEKKVVKYFLCIGCGMLFHYSILVVLPFFLICRYKLKLGWSICFIILAFIAMQIGVTNYLFKIIVSFFPGHYGAYAEIYNSFANTQTSLGVYLRVVSWILILCIAYRNIEDDKDIILYNLFVYGILLYLCFLSVDILIRLADYFLTVIILILPQTFYSLKICFNRYVYIGYVLLFLFLIYITTISFDSAGLFPYKTFFSF